LTGDIVRHLISRLVRPNCGARLCRTGLCGPPFEGETRTDRWSTSYTATTRISALQRSLMVADYGLEADLFVAVPEMANAI
jgi:hypothetical protein